MVYLVVVFLIIVVVYGPQFWSQYILKKYNRDEYFSGSGMDLAEILLDRMNLPQVRMEATDLGDHYDPLNKVVRLSRTNCGKKTLTAVVVAAHEVGHAVQYQLGYTPLYLRTKWIVFAKKAERLGVVLMISIPAIAAVTRVPAAGLLIFLVGLASLLIPVIIHLVTLPVEWDASFKRALPILETGEYIPKDNLPAARRILTACTLTYVASALASLLNLWRWIRVLRR